MSLVVTNTDAPEPMVADSDSQQVSRIATEPLRHPRAPFLQPSRSSSEKRLHSALAAQERYDLNETSGNSDMEITYAAKELVVLNATPVEPVEKTELEQQASAAPQTSAPLQESFVVSQHDSPPVRPVRRIFSRTYAMHGGSLSFPAGKCSQHAPFVEITNKPEGLQGIQSMVRHNLNVIAKEAPDSLYSLHAGSRPTQVSARGVSSGTMPFLFVTSFKGSVGDFVNTLPQMPAKLKDVSEAPYSNPLVSVIDTLAAAYSGLFGYQFANFRPTPFVMRDAAIRPDILFKVWWYAANLTGQNDLKKEKAPLYFMNMLHLDPRAFWDTYESDTGAPRHWLVAGDWWFRFKVRAPAPRESTPQAPEAGSLVHRSRVATNT
jgi:hypothetical protein